MQRSVAVHMELTVTEPALLALQVAVATDGGRQQLLVSHEGAPMTPREVAAPHGGRMHVIEAPAGGMVLDYRAEITGELAVPDGDEHDRFAYRRPSRYCPSDRFLAIAAAEFDPVTDPATYVRDVAGWVGGRLLYTSGSSGPTDDAVDSLLLGEGVCRDYAHLVVSLLRARDIPARLAAVYAPGLQPMDFHAVVEAEVEGGWRVVDATGLAPRASMLRIATGRDAADTAFMSVHHGAADLEAITVTAVVDELPTEDPDETIVLA